MPPLALLVDSDELFLSRLSSIARASGYDVVAETQFEAARRRLLTSRPAVVIANIRLRAFNGIHLAYLAKMADPDARVILYDHVPDPVLAREAQRALAFYERQQGLPYALERYLAASLPDRDRRDPRLVCRRATFRGGRRTTDLDSLQSTLRVPT